MNFNEISNSMNIYSIEEKLSKEMTKLLKFKQFRVEIQIFVDGAPRTYDPFGNYGLVAIKILENNSYNGGYYRGWGTPGTIYENSTKFKKEDGGIEIIPRISRILVEGFYEYLRENIIPNRKIIVAPTFDFGRNTMLKFARRSRTSIEEACLNKYIIVSEHEQITYLLKMKRKNRIYVRGNMNDAQSIEERLNETKVKEFEKLCMSIELLLGKKKNGEYTNTKYMNIEDSEVVERYEMFLNEVRRRNRSRHSINNINETWDANEELNRSRERERQSQIAMRNWMEASRIRQDNEFENQYLAFPTFD